MTNHGTERRPGHGVRRNRPAPQALPAPVDARTLAHLLRARLLPEAYIAPREVRDLRELLRQRVVLTNARSALKNRVHALLARQGVRHSYSDLFGVRGRAFLELLELRPPQRQRLDTLLRLIDAFDGEQARSDPRVSVLRRLPGIGPYTALLVISEVGEIGRFASARQLCSYAGLTPRIRASAGKARLGRISRQGPPYLRFALVEAAQKASQSGGPLRKRFERIARRRGRNVAKVALARHLLTLCYYGLRDGEIRCLARASSPQDMAASS